MTSKNKIPISLVIALCGVLIGLAGELMPDYVKSGVETFATEKTGLSFIAVWVIGILILISVLLFFVWREAKQPATPDTPPADNAKTTVNQYGNKSVNIKNSKGDININ